MSTHNRIVALKGRRPRDHRAARPFRAQTLSRTPTQGTACGGALGFRIAPLQGALIVDAVTPNWPTSTWITSVGTAPRNQTDPLPERHVVMHVPMPFGMSIVCLVRKH